MTKQKTVEVAVDGAKEIIARRGKKILLREKIHSLNENTNEWELVGDISLIMDNLKSLVEQHGRKVRILIKLRDGGKLCYRGNGNCSNLLGSQYKNYKKVF